MPDLGSHAAQDLFDDRHIVVDLLGSAIDVDEQDRVNGRRIAGAGELLQRNDASAVELLQCGRHDPGFDDGGDGGIRIMSRGEATYESARERSNGAESELR